jgi:GT2 family glycosyltransferase/glycosyltransferase involved in cell wall biosynthesis/SAM-dependent methyltransferase
LNILLKQAGYQLNDELNIWSRPDYSSINYSDGDSTELRIKFLIDQASDVSVFSDELRRSCTDWPSLYYLSSTRSNLLRVFDADLRGDVLEIGAGCGAITRYLGEQGGRVLALEGSSRRASIARARTRDLPNVSVLAESFENFSIDTKFDVITLIGVFEYANLFVSGDNPGARMLEKVRTLLKPDGLLIVAIENQLGLKYFAGAPEDHVSTAMYGVEGRYNNATVQTYGKKALAALLANSGFTSSEFFAPFPDYKLPVSIVTEAGFKDPDFDASAFASQSVQRDPQLPDLCTFSLELAWSQIFRNGLGMDMANSFLVGASPVSRNAVDPQTLAFHFSSDRRSMFCKRSEFRRDSIDSINVHYEKLGKSADGEGAQSLVTFKLSKSEPYINGYVLSTKLIDIVNTEGWTYVSVGSFLKEYLTILEALCDNADSQLGEVSGALIDAVPQNIVIDCDGRPQLIDKEWSLNTNIRHEYLLFKALTQMLGSITRLNKGAELGPVTRKHFVFSACEAAGYPLTEDDVKEFLALEAQIQNTINGRSTGEFLEWGEEQLVVEDNLFTAYSASQIALTETRDAVAAARLEVDLLCAKLHQREADYNQIINSNSWFITKPVRFLVRSLRQSKGVLRNKLEASKQTLASYLRDKELRLPQQIDEVLEAPITRIRSVSVILPIYKDVEMTQRCILAAMPGILSSGSKLVAINDASPDAGMQTMLLELQKQWPAVMTVLENEANLGFVKTVNRGMRHASQDDIVFLNSDVIVPVDWLQRLTAEAYIAPNIGTVTPFSNNATICSFPAFLLENEAAFGLSVEQIDAVFRTPRLPVSQAPTGVGFCMYVRRDCLDVIGLLNEEKFGRGYGEENDLCQRGLKAGWLNIITPNLYAFHEGGVSFSSSKQALTEHASKVITELHPDYHLDIQRFISADPVKPVRVRRFAQLIASMDRPKVLHVSHEAGGGVQQHLDELAQSLETDVCCLFLAPRRGTFAVTLRMGSFPGADEVLFQLPQEHELLVSFLKGCGVNLVHFHHTLGLNPALVQLPQALEVDYVLTVHDYYWLCGNPTLTNEQGVYPGAYDDDISNPNFPLPEGIGAAQWREQLRGFIEGAKAVVFPSAYTLTNYQQHYQLPNAVVVGHVEQQRDIGKPVQSVPQKLRYNVGVIGALGKEKGADYLEQIAAAAAAVNAPINLRLIGFGYRELNGVLSTGRYNSADLASLIVENDFDVVLFPSQCPETYSYTLSYALEAGLPIIAPNIGAFPERLSGRENTFVYEYGIEPAALMAKISDFVKKLAAGESFAAPIVDTSTHRKAFYEADYPAICKSGVGQRGAQDALFELPEFVTAASAYEAPLTTREIALLALWTFYRRPGMQRISNSVPYALRQKIKRLLTKRPLHEIVDVNKN